MKEESMHTAFIFLGGGKITDNAKFVETMTLLHRKPWCMDITAWEKSSDVTGLTIKGYSEKWKRNFTCTTAVANDVFDGSAGNPVDFIESMVLESDADTP